MDVVTSPKRGKMFLSPIVWCWVNDQEAGGEEPKKRAPRGHHGNDDHTVHSFHYGAQSWGHQDLTDVSLQKSHQYFNIIIWLILTCHLQHSAWLQHNSHSKILKNPILIRVHLLKMERKIYLNKKTPVQQFLVHITPTKQKYLEYF